MPDRTQAIVVDADVPGRLAIRPVDMAPASPGDLTVRVTAISLNRGEVKRALTTSAPGTRPGWDFVGVVAAPARDGRGPAVGTRVVGLLPSGAWAAHLRVPVEAIAVLPDVVSDAQAATLPVAGLTALHALRRGGLLLGRKVLIDGASGGVGHLAVQLAAASGARVYGHVRREEMRATIARWCTGGVIVGPGLEDARIAGPFHLILDSVGGGALGAALSMLESGGACVTFGVSESDTARFHSAEFFRKGGVTLHGLMVFDELARTEPASSGLALLVGLVESGHVEPIVAVQAPWTEVAQVARDLLDRRFSGKAVLHVSG